MHKRLIMDRTKRLEGVKEIICSGTFPTQNEYFQGADLIVTNEKEVTRYDVDHMVILNTRHAGPISWLIYELKDIFRDRINSTNKHHFYAEIGEILIAQLQEDGDPIQAMLNVVDEIEEVMTQ